MEPIFKNILVVLNNHSDDQAVLHGLKDFLKEDPDHEKVLFAHVPEDLNLPHIRFNAVGFSEKKVLTALENSLSKKIRSSLGEDFDFDLMVSEGHPVNDLVKIVIKEEIDLVILSTHDDNEGGLNNPQFVRHSPCSVLMLNRVRSLKFSRILVPIDCSHHSQFILNKVLLASPRRKDSQVQFLHVFPRPSAFYESGMNFDDFAKIAGKSAKEEVDSFLSQIDLGELNYKSDVVMDPGHNIAKTIVDDARKEGADLIIIGSKGKTGPATMLLGSVTEKILNYSNDIPVLIVKDSKQEINLISALKKV